MQSIYLYGSLMIAMMGMTMAKALTTTEPWAQWVFQQQQQQQSLWMASDRVRMSAKNSPFRSVILLNGHSSATPHNQQQV